VPILLNEVIDALGPRPGEAVADGTLGYGGHAAEFLRRIGLTGRLVGFDVDAEQLERTRQRLAELPGDVSVHRSNFAGIDKALATEGLSGYDIIFADLGVSSMQVDDPRRGFSYKHDGPLDMRMDDRLPRTAADLLRDASQADIAAALRDLADEPSAEAIAREVIRVRAARPLLRTGDLSDLVFAVKGVTRDAWRQRAKAGELHPAALTFQAMRIWVNDELASLKHLLRIASYCLRPGGRIGIISFHSGEDRLVEQAFRDGQTVGAYETVSDEVIRPGSDEINANPRSRSAKFRWARKGE
jgi:16S rRNA (cytosine1402-N4)-methyltransferase